MSRTLPERANLEFLSKQAKQLLQEAKAKDPAAKLADCQHTLAREYGFPSWAKLKAHVEQLAAVDPMDALAAAIRSREPDAVRQALARHPAITKRLDEPLRGGDFGATPLITAVNQGNRPLVEVLLDAGADINQRSHWWAGGFHVLENDHGLADFLIERGARLDAKSAAQLGRLDALRQLVAADPASVNLRRGDGQTPLHVAPTVEIAAFLLDHGADIDARDVDHESTPAQYLVRSHPDVARFLVERGARCDIMLAAALGDVNRVRQLLDNDPALVRVTVSHRYYPKRNPHAGGHIYTWVLGDGKTPHAVAREFGHSEVVRLLLERTPASLKLAIACELKDDALLAELTREQPGLAATLSEEERIKLTVAARNNDVEAVQRMLAAGWPVDAVGQHGATALHWAGFHGNPDLARAILPFTPPLEARERDFGQTPLQWTLYGSVNGWHAASGDYVGVAELLLAAGAKVPAITKETQGTAAVLQVVRSAGK